MSAPTAHRDIGEAPTADRWYRRPWFLASVVAGVLLILVMSVFTVSGLARGVTDATQRSHANNEVLRVTSAVQTQLSVADGYRQLGDDVDTTTVVQSSASVAASGLANLATARENPFLSTEVRDGLVRYVAIAEQHLGAPTGEAGFAEVESSYDSLVEAIVASRAVVNAELEAVNSRMNSVASAAGFIIAFVVPATGLYVWESLRRTRARRAVLEEQLHLLHTDRSDAHTDLAAQLPGLRRQANQVVEALNSDHREVAIERSHELARTVGRLDVATRSGSHTMSSVRGPVRLVDLLGGAEREALVATLTLPNREQLPPGVAVHVDSALFTSALVELFRFHSVGGASLTVRVEVEADTVALALHGQPSTNADVLGGDEHRAPTADDSELGQRERERANIGRMVEAAGGRRHELTTGPTDTATASVCRILLDRAAVPGAPADDGADAATATADAQVTP
jgi:hypothetical protein